MVERSEKEIARIISRVIDGIEGVRGQRQLDVRVSGKRIYVEMYVFLDSNLRFEEAHRIALNIERRVKSAIPGARVIIHTEPLKSGGEDIWRLVKETAEKVPGSRGVHNIHIQTINGKIYVDLHLEVSANMTVKQAHDVSEKVERRIKAANSKVSEITVHMESASDRISRELIGVETELESYIKHVADRFPEIRLVHKIEVRKVDDSLHVALRCHFDPNITMKEAHEISNSLEKEIRGAYPRIARIDVHEEPA